MMVPLQHRHHHCTKVILMMLCLLLLLFIVPASASASASVVHSQRQPRRVLLHSINDKPNSTITTAKTSSKDQTKSIKPISSNSSKNQTKLTQPSSTSSKNQTKFILPSSASFKNQTKLGQTSPTSSKNQTKLTKPSSTSTKNQTKLTKPSPSASKNQTKPIKGTTDDASKNKTKLTKPTSDSKHDSSGKSQTKRLNSTSNSKTKMSSISPKKPTDLPKLTPPKNKKTKKSKPHETEHKSNSPVKAQVRPQKPPNKIVQDDEDEDDDLISEFRDLPYKFHETLVPDLEKFSKTSRIYLTNYNQGITEGFKPYVGNKHAATVASITSFACIIVPLILVSLIFNRITAYIPLQKILIFIQFYLTMYFAILGLSAVATGIEPLKFFYSASPSLYVGVQAMKIVGYVLYLMLLLMYLVTAFMSESGLGAKLLSLAQTLVGFAIGLHYYVTVFHRALRHQPPKTSWKVHALYATCFLVICLLGTAGRRKKAYVEEGGEEGKKS